MAITREKSLVVDMTNNLNDPLGEYNLWHKTSIYSVPHYMKKLNPKAYKPMVVSFGPYHHGDPDLLPMEEHKHRALQHFLWRLNKTLGDLIPEMEDIVQQLQNSYQNLGKEWHDRDRFLQLMILDGIFMLEVIRSWPHIPADYASNDPIFSTKGMLYNRPFFRRDMLMIENQLPLLVLEKLLAAETGNSGKKEQINRLVIKFLTPRGPLPPPDMELGLHVLDLHRRSLLHYVNYTKSPAFKSDGANTLISARMRYRAGRKSIIRSVSEQYESGIRFRKSDSGSLLDVRFNKGILSLPMMVLDEFSEFLFLNIVAFEHLHMGTGSEISLYIDFIISMLNTTKDARLLYEERILVGTSDEDIMKFFTDLSKELVLDPEAIVECSPFLAEFIKMQEYLFNTCRTSWSRWWEYLKMEYFSNPWTILSLAAAIILLGLTVAQTVYTIYPYYHPR